MSPIRPEMQIFRVYGPGELNLVKTTESFETIEDTSVYNLQTADEHNFIASGVIAHNFAFLKTARTLFHRFFIDRYEIRRF
jgi:hypothetical protein